MTPTDSKNDQTAVSASNSTALFSVLITKEEIRKLIKESHNDAVYWHQQTTKVLARDFPKASVNFRKKAIQCRLRYNQLRAALKSLENA